eukprot:3000179-Prymnesium_polylepis.1
MSARAARCRSLAPPPLAPRTGHPRQFRRHALARHLCRGRLPRQPARGHVLVRHHAVTLTLPAQAPPPR